MLHDKRGVITEERFQKMTMGQWMFHYEECMRAKRQSIKEQNGFRTFLQSIATWSHPKIDVKKLIESLQQEKLKRDAPQMQEEMMEDFMKAMEVLPFTLDIQLDEPEKPPVLPVANIPKRKKRKKKKDLKESGDDTWNSKTP